jgi:hypothetical protein
MKRDRSALARLPESSNTRLGNPPKKRIKHSKISKSFESTAMDTQDRMHYDINDVDCKPKEHHMKSSTSARKDPAGRLMNAVMASLHEDPMLCEPSNTPQLTEMGGNIEGQDNTQLTTAVNQILKQFQNNTAELNSSETDMKC